MRELLVEEQRNFVRVVFHPNLSCTREESLLRELSEKYRGRLVFLFVSRGSCDLLCTTILSRTKDFHPNRLKDRIEKYFESIRGCVIDNQSGEDCGKLTLYSPQRAIHLKISFYKKSFEVTGDTKSLCRFLRSYSKAIEDLTAQTEMNIESTSITNAMSLCEKIEKNLWMSSTPSSPSLSANDPRRHLTTASPEFPSPSDESTTSESETQCPILALNTPPSPIGNGTTIESTPPVINETPCSPATQTDFTSSNNSQPSSLGAHKHTPTSPTSKPPPPPPLTNETPNSASTESKLDLILKKLTHLESHTEKIPQLSSRLDQALQQINKNTDRLNTSDARLCKLETTVATIKDNFVTKTINNDINNLKNTISNLENQLQELKNQVESSPLLFSSPAPSTENRTDFESLIDQKLKSLQTDLETKLQHPTQRQAQPPKQKYTPTSIEELKHNLLLIGDSNTYHVKEDILKNGKTAAKIMAYRIEEAITAINKLNISSPPEKILVNLGTNHLSSLPNVVNDVEAIKSHFNELFDALDAKFPRSDIYISEILIRREDKVDSDVKALNAFFKSTCDNRDRFRLIVHSYTIDSKQYHLRDNRHLSMPGFWEFLANIRLQMLGIPRKFWRNDQHHHGYNYDYNYNQGHSFNRRNQRDFT